MHKENFAYPWWLAILLVIWLAGCLNRTEVPQFRGTDIGGAAFARDFHLADQNGRMRSLGDFRGKVVLLTFGYTHCPDVCPTTLANLAAAVASLGEKGKQVQVLFVTLDPARDKPALLAQYMPFFNRDFLALYGDERETSAAAAEFHVYYQKQDLGSAAGYALDHSAGIFAFDPAGRLRLHIAYDSNVDDIVHDVRLLMN
ncbi:photosynthetic protein synthase I [Sulfurimicrobium lacus]|uniref:Photosynthetic protein synthase I n=1 Tax=Sulfurimicrobium lacus TaxID=2715678 RepID=A0A6F8VCN8_9PROT|nr:SCO family protein [Sulfurimicrobium lacus]BCB27488.1 photosynthetic protein synthase I [Sulfurimicrobium lacus]